ncbi:MAG TPA: class I SAM-dependent methyltransferase [Bacteroidales bacterium]|nr:class I SAM-dependent methyltransferase [Bacteroidales bacterium]
MTDYPSLIFRLLYWYLNKLDKHKKLIFMNFGYYDSERNLSLSPEDEYNRYPLQLYHHMAEMVDLRNKDIVDVGSGRGGGLSFIAKYYQAASLKGIDRGKDSIEFSKKYHKHDKLMFLHGDAQDLPIEDESCDVILNVESSHRYQSMDLFLKEVSRTLRPGGYFLFTDFRYDEKWDELLKLIEESGMLVLAEKDITDNIVKALELDSERRQELIRQYVPRVLRKKILNFSGSTGTETYEYFRNRKFTYRSFKVIKPAIN